jgi:hypothetical protein
MDPPCYEDDIDLDTHQVGHKLGSAIGVSLGISVLEVDILSFYVTNLAQSQPNPLRASRLMRWVTR